MTILQNILSPDQNAGEYTELYVHTAGGKVLYDGYYNIFSALKWACCTRIRSLYLFVKSNCRGRLRFMTDQGNELCSYVLEETGDGSCSGTMLIPEWREHEFFWAEWEPEQEGAGLSGYFFTEDVSDREVKIGIAICTYRRERCVEETVRRLRESVLDDPGSPASGRLEVLIIDNGQTLDEKQELFQQEHIQVIRNKNAGGSGGFCRGMMEAIEQSGPKGITHVLLQDDDAEIGAEAYVRTIALLRYIKDEYSKACVGGELLDIERPWILNEAGALYRKGLSEVPLRGTDLRDRDRVMETERFRACDYTGWWYACFPLGEVVTQDNLPLPMFIHYDDIEYGLRNRSRIVFLNGICARHASFERRYSQSQLYYGIRNRLITNALRTEGDMYREELTYIRGTILYDSLRYLYSSADLCCLAVRDFCRGPAFFQKTDPEKTNAEVSSLAVKFRPTEELEPGSEKRKRIEEYFLGNSGKGRVSKWLYRLTLNGWLLPAAEEVSVCSVFSEDMRDIYRSRKVLLTDPFSGRYAESRKDYRKLLHSVLCYVRIRRIMRKYYRRSVSQFRTQEKHLESAGFWKRYLN